LALPLHSFSRHHPRKLVAQYSRTQMFKHGRSGILVARS
jgi:hypothetical protein